MRPIRLVVGSKPIGDALTWAYPKGQEHGVFKIPTYQLTVSGKNAKGLPDSRNFEVLRFGILCNKATDKPSVVGLAE